MSKVNVFDLEFPNIKLNLCGVVVDGTYAFGYIAL